MRKINLQSVIWGILLVVSLSAYVYLAEIRCESLSHSPTQAISQEELTDELQDSKVILPDIALVKKILNFTKIVLPKE